MGSTSGKAINGGMPGNVGKATPNLRMLDSAKGTQ
jgi:hypothetical protein